MCGSDAHELEVCPETPKGPIEVVVEKFGATKLQNENDLGHQSPPPATPPAEKWVTVAPKKRGRTLPLSKRKSMPKVVVAPASPSVRVVPSSSSPVLPAVPPYTLAPSGMTLHSSALEDVKAPPTLPTPHLGPAWPVAAAIPPVPSLAGEASLPGSSPVLEPATSGNSRHMPSGPSVFGSTPTSPLEGSDLDDDDVTMFLNLENEEDVQISSESTKKRRLEEGDASSPSQSAL